MVTLHPNFRQTIKTFVDQRVRAAYDQMRGLSACAGIWGDEGAAFKARVNHHGSPSRMVPARRFISAAIEDTEMTAFNQELKEVIHSLINEAHPRSLVGSVPHKTFNPSTGDTKVTFVDIVEHTTPFGQKGMGPSRLMRKIAEQMARNQMRSVTGHDFPAGPMNGNDPAHNTPRVAKSKGKDYPMHKSGHTINKIQAWIEE